MLQLSQRTECSNSWLTRLIPQLMPPHEVTCCHGSTRTGVLLLLLLLLAQDTWWVAAAPLPQPWPDSELELLEARAWCGGGGVPPF